MHLILYICGLKLFHCPIHKGGFKWEISIQTITRPPRFSKSGYANDAAGKRSDIIMPRNSSESAVEDSALRIKLRYRT